jgi:hypothetical protein
VVTMLLLLLQECGDAVPGYVTVTDAQPGKL